MSPFQTLLLCVCVLSVWMFFCVCPGGLLCFALLCFALVFYRACVCLLCFACLLGLCVCVIVIVRVWLFVRVLHSFCVCAFVRFVGAGDQDEERAGAAEGGRTG